LDLPKKEASMADKVFKKISVTGCSSESFEKAIEIAVEKASVSLRSLGWFEVKELRGGLGADGQIEWQATIEVAFKVD
jgi:flavin-binding protein dodecin